MSNPTELRDVLESDLDIFFEFMQDSESQQMAAFVHEDPADREAFDAHWQRMLASKEVVTKTIVHQGQVVGNLARFIMFEQPEVTYWIGKDHWGKGLATQGLKLFLEIWPERPLYARAAGDNKGSIRVLEKCGFVLSGHDKGFANARGQEIEEVIMKLE